MTPARSGLLLSLVFFCVAVTCLGILPLWLDEVLQLLETRDPSISQMLVEMPGYPGSVPLGYLVQHVSLRITGFSERRARLPMAIFGAASIFLVALLAAELGVRRAWLAATLFAAFPLTFRYATEARPYSQALFLSLLATLIYVRAGQGPSWKRGVLYGVALTSAIYTQPFAGIVGVALVLWSVLEKEYLRAAMGAAASVMSGLLFMPWYFWSKNGWAAMQGPDALHFSATLKTPLMLFREVAGAGYWGSGLLLILCALALAGRLPSARSISLLIWLIAVPVLLIPVADAVFDYFIAARQIIWVLPAIAILAASAVEKFPRAGLGLAALFCVVGIVQSIRYFAGQHDNFKLPARRMAEEFQRGACLTVAGKDQFRLYKFFEPELSPTSCTGNRMVLTLSPYLTEKERIAALEDLGARGYKEQSVAQAGSSRLVFFQR